MYKDEKEEKGEKITSFAKNLQKDKGKAPQQSSEKNKPFGKSKESNPSPFVVSFKSSKPLPEDDTSSSQADTQQVQPALTPLETPAGIEDHVSAFFVGPAASTKGKPIFFHKSNTSLSNSSLKPFQNEVDTNAAKSFCRPVDEDIDLLGYLFEELPDKDPGSSSNWYDFSDNEEELSEDTDTRFSDSEEPSSPKEVPYFDPVSAEAEPWSENAFGNPEGLVELEAIENIVEEPPLNVPTKDYVQKIDLGIPDNPRPVFISKNIKDDELPEYNAFLHEFVDCFAWSYAEMPCLDPKITIHKLNLRKDIKPVKQGQRRFCPDVMDKIEQEVQKLKNVGFIREE
ncbi:hypothetical protein AAC387_Pa08g1140 [Persea americana]